MSTPMRQRHPEKQRASPERLITILRRTAVKRRQWIMAAAIASSLALAAAGTASPSTEATAPTSAAHRVSFDKYSFLIDGKRTYLWSGEVHPYRLPSPELWPDIFQKMKAAGFNTASIYFSWGYHSPREGQYDFSGVRNLDKLLDDARDA
ncbi:MAG TPA: beta-galactosidase, partial [Rhodanobacter sp.]|nr:beta-galactosidase [Rhodanobacter sp.]